MENTDEKLISGLNARFVRNATVLEIFPDEETLITIYDSEDDEIRPMSNYGSANQDDTIGSVDFHQVIACDWVAWLDLILAAFLLFSIFHKWRGKMAISESVKIAAGIREGAFSI